MADKIRVQIDECHYITVAIYKTTNGLRKSSTIDSGFDGLWQLSGYHIRNYKPVIEKEFGVISLSLDTITGGIFAHELTHFLIDWVRLNRIDIETCNEIMANLIGQMTEDFWTIFHSKYKRG